MQITFDANASPTMQLEALTTMFAYEFLPINYLESATPEPVPVIDTHDGERDKRYRQQKEAAERRREQIRRAIDGPDADILVPALERVATPGPEPLIERVNMGELLAQVELWRAVREGARAWGERERAIDEDDEEVLLLT